MTWSSRKFYVSTFAKMNCRLVDVCILEMTSISVRQYYKAALIRSSDNTVTHITPRSKKYHILMKHFGLRFGHRFDTISLKILKISIVHSSYGQIADRKFGEETGVMYRLKQYKIFSNEQIFLMCCSAWARWKSASTYSLASQFSEFLTFGFSGTLNMWIDIF